MNNSRVAILKQSARYSLMLLFWIPVIFFSLLLVRNTVPYFSFAKDFSFIQERALLFAKPAYNFCFYAHVGAGMFCVSSALLQLSTSIIRRRSFIHVWSGRIYVFVVMMIGAPTGLYMAFFAKGGYAEHGLFVFMAIYWFFATMKGLQTILAKKVLAHKIWMIRSYCMAMTAVSFRLYHMAFFAAGWGHLENYEISLWISVLGNILVAELVIWRMSKNYLASFHS